VLGWKSLYDHGFYIDGEVGISFLYIISGLHLAHILAGLLFLLYLTFNAFDNWNDPIKALVYFSNKYEEVKLEVFSTFWHFIDVLWVVLFFTFLFTF
jgi:cytochrome c oxidase subunit 3